MNGDLADRLAFLTGQLNAIVLAMRQAKARGDQVDLESLKGALQNVTVQITQLENDAIQADAPSSFMLTLDQLSTAAISAAQEAGTIVAKTGEAIPDVLKSLTPAVIIAAVLLFILLYKRKA